MERPRPDPAAVQELLRQIDDRSQRDPQFMEAVQHQLSLLANASTEGPAPDGLPGAAGSRRGAFRWLPGSVAFALVSAVLACVTFPPNAVMFSRLLAPGLLLLVLLLAVTTHFSTVHTADTDRVRDSQPAGPAAAERAKVYETERARAARWARTLIWASGGAWALFTAFMFTAESMGGSVVASSFGPPGAEYLSNLLLVIAYLIATLAAFYLMVNQRELVEKRADASGFAAVSRFDHREEVLGTAATAQATPPRMKTQPA